MDIKNCARMPDYDSEHSYYVIIDTSEDLADECFIRNRVNVEYQSEFTRKDFPYKLKKCRIKKGQERQFDLALQELMVAVYINGRDDYREVCEALSGKAELIAAGDTSTKS